MTCQHCQTWILDDDHRCPRCGRRVRSSPSRISPSTYPIAAAATARAYDFATQESLHSAPETARFETSEPAESRPGQQPLFPQPINPPRVISFETLTTPAERESIRARAADLLRPAPIKTEKISVRHARAQKRQPATHEQRRLEFMGQEEVLSAPQASMICDAPVAPVSIRLQAAALDAVIIGFGCFCCIAFFEYVGGQIPTDKHLLPFFLLVLTLVPLLYKLLWAFAGRDTIGMQKAGLRLVDFDGNPPSQERRYQRLFGSLLSFLAAGMGLVWMFVDEDALAWHDHISGTFPTLAGDE